MPRKKAKAKASTKGKSYHRFFYVGQQLDMSAGEGPDGMMQLKHAYCLDVSPFRSLLGRFSELNGEQRKLVIAWITGAAVGDMLSLSADEYLVYLGWSPSAPVGHQLGEKMVPAYELQRMKRQ